VSANFCKICYHEYVKNYIKPGLFVGIIIIVVSFVITLAILRPLQEYIPVLSLWEYSILPIDSTQRTVGDVIIGLKLGNANILLSLLIFVLWVCISFLILFIINFFKKKFAVNTLKVIFDYPWKPYYSFWMFWLIGFPLIINILLLIIDLLEYLLKVHIFAEIEIPRFVLTLIAIIIWISAINIIPVITKHLKK